MATRIPSNWQRVPKRELPLEEQRELERKWEARKPVHDAELLAAGEFGDYSEHLIVVW